MATIIEAVLFDLSKSLDCYFKVLGLALLHLLFDWPAFLKFIFSRQTHYDRRFSTYTNDFCKSGRYHTVRRYVWAQIKMDECNQGVHSFIVSL